MAAPDPPKPDDLVEAIVASVFGPDSTVLYVFVVVTFLLAWYSLARATHRRARNSYARVSALPGTRRARAVLYGIVTPAVQTVYLTLSWFIASHIEPTMRETEGPADMDVASWLVPADDPTGTPGFWIWITVAFVLVASGWWSALGMYGDVTPFHPVAWLLFGCGVVAVVVLLAANRMMAGLAFVYLVAAVLALYLPRTCARAWRTGR